MCIVILHEYKMFTRCVPCTVLNDYGVPERFFLSQLRAYFLGSLMHAEEEFKIPKYFLSY